MYFHCLIFQIEDIYQEIPGTQFVTVLQFV